MTPDGAHAPDDLWRRGWAFRVAEPAETRVVHEHDKPIVRQFVDVDGRPLIQITDTRVVPFGYQSAQPREGRS